MFVDGCFWHGCPKHVTWPKQNAEFWRTRILRNQARDAEVNRLLKQAGWRVLRIWELNLVTMTSADFARDRARKPFLRDALAKEKLFIKGSADELERLG